jgi:hypothetical protein
MSSSYINTMMGSRGGIAARSLRLVLSAQVGVAVSFIYGVLMMRRARH